MPRNLHGEVKLSHQQPQSVPAYRVGAMAQHWNPVVPAQAAGLALGHHHLNGCVDGSVRGHFLIPRLVGRLSIRPRSPAITDEKASAQIARNGDLVFLPRFNRCWIINAYAGAILCRECGSAPDHASAVAPRRSVDFVLCRSIGARTLSRSEATDGAPTSRAVFALAEASSLLRVFRRTPSNHRAWRPALAAPAAKIRRSNLHRLMANDAIPGLMTRSPRPRPQLPGLIRSL